MMTCPRCGDAEVLRSLSQERAGYMAFVLCETCGRQVMVLRDEPGDAVDAAEALFFGKGDADG